MVFMIGLTAVSAPLFAHISCEEDTICAHAHVLVHVWSTRIQKTSLLRSGYEL